MPLRILQVTVKNVAGEAPNGSAFTITLGAAPELDRTNLVVGRVVSGMDDVVARLAALPRSKPRDEWFDKVIVVWGSSGFGVCCKLLCQSCRRCCVQRSAR